MADRENIWIERIAEVDKLVKSKSTSKGSSHCIIKPGQNKIEIALYSELDPLLKLGDWAVLTVSPQKFVSWSEIFKQVIKGATNTINTLL